MTDKNYQEIYETLFKPAFEKEDYSKANEIYLENPGLENLMTPFEMKKLIDYKLNNSKKDLEEIVSIWDTIFKLRKEREKRDLNISNFQNN